MQFAVIAAPDAAGPPAGSEPEGTPMGSSGHTPRAGATVRAPLASAALVLAMAACLLGLLLVAGAQTAAAAGATIGVGSYPVAVAVNPVTNTLYVVNQLSNDVSVIDGATGAVTTVDVGICPWDVAVNSVTNKVYVANYGEQNTDSTVSVIDGVTNDVTTVTVGNNPESLAVNSVTNRIYVANFGGNDVSVIDGETDAVIATIAVGPNPWAVAVNAVTNRIYVASFTDDGQVSVINGATNAAATVSVGAFPSDVAVNAETNTVYVANYDSDDVSVIDGATNEVTTVDVGHKPYAVAVNAVTDKVYVANYGYDWPADPEAVPDPAFPSTVSVIDGVTNGVTTVDVGRQPDAVAVNSATNRIYVANSGDANVSVINGVTLSVTTVDTGSSPIAAVVNAANSKTYVVNAGDGTVTAIEDRAGESASALISGGEFSSTSVIAGTFGGTLTGTSSVLRASTDFGGSPFSGFVVTDARGTGVGWSVTMKATQFDNGVAGAGHHVIALGSLTMPQLAVHGNSGSSEVPGDLHDATAIDLGLTDGVVMARTTTSGQGMGIYTFTSAGAAPWELALTADDYAGTYHSTVTTTLATLIQ